MLSSDSLVKSFLVATFWLDEAYLVINWSGRPHGYRTPWFLHTKSFFYNFSTWEITWFNIKYLVCIFLPWFLKNAAPLLLCFKFFFFFEQHDTTAILLSWSYLIFLPEGFGIFNFFFRSNNFIRVCLRVDGFGSTFTTTCWVFSVCRSSSNF